MSLHSAWKQSQWKRTPLPLNISTGSSSGAISYPQRLQTGSSSGKRISTTLRSNERLVVAGEPVAECVVG